MLRGRLLLWLLVLVLGAMTARLVAERNARSWGLTLDHDRLVVSRGRDFLFGTRTISADDPELGKIYGPIQVPSNTKLGATDFDDQLALDRALFETLLPVAQAAQPGDVASRERAAAILERLSRLPGLTAAELDRLAAVRGDFAYEAAQGNLREALRLVQQAWRRLQVVGGGKGEHALEASGMAAALPGVAAALEDLATGRAPTAPGVEGPPSHDGH
jgi:hypothetical protein